MKNSFVAFIIGHSEFAESLKTTVEKITGQQPNLFAYSNKAESLSNIYKKIRERISKFESDKKYIFVDLMGGSCWSLASMVAREYPEIIIISGVNLPMVISLIINHHELDTDHLTNKILEDSKKSIQILNRK